MKKGFLKNVLGALAITLGVISFSAEAREIRITGNGSGGTSHGDRDAACGRAYERAENDAYDQCDNRNGDPLSMTQGSCNCRRKPGTRDDYVCDATVRLTCEVACRPQVTQISGTGLGFDFNRSVACDDAFRRAEDDTQWSCSRRGGYVVDTREQSCNCRRLVGGDYECRSNVTSTCELQSCR